ncbi:MAG: 3-deoxy-8-phosphooctulonate synthase [Myxococcales bacterium]|nr:3-deoxy-8-phosphooctulonate synthase [Myxococcales bacterium]
MTLRIGEHHVGGDNPPLLISGNCVLEDLDTALRTAEFVAEVARRHHFNPVFKASFDKANRSRKDSFRGPGLDQGLEWLAQIGRQTGLPLLTDVHLPSQCEVVAEVVDILQIPAFLCRQTDLLESAAVTGKIVNVKKGQFLAPEAMRNAIQKVRDSGNNLVLVTERGSCFGYGDLIVDYRGFSELRSQAPLIFDATHSAQRPAGASGVTGGDRRLALPLARAATAVGIDGLFAEVHPDPERALSDAANALNFALLDQLLASCSAILTSLK